MKIPKYDELVTQKQAAEIRGVSPQAINRLVKDGRFRTVTIGARQFLFRKEVEQYEPKKRGPVPKSSKQSGKKRHRSKDQ